MRITDSLTYAAILAAMCFPDDVYAAGEERFISDCAGKVAIAHARVLRVERGGALILPDGRTLVLEGIQLAVDGDMPGALAERAQAALSGLVLSGPVNFTAGQPSRDRYGRLRVQGFGREWLQIALLEQGLARAAISPDRTECAPDLYEAESRARARQAGLWTLAAYRVRMPQDMQGATGSFQLVQGRVSHIGRADGRTFLDFGGQGRWSFSALIASDDRRAFRDFDLDALAGRNVRVRGIVQNYRGRPEIALANPSQIEVLD